MKIMRVSATCGSPCGVVNLALLVDSVDLEHGKYILSLRDELWMISLPKTEDGMWPNHIGTFELGKAKASIIESLDSGGRRTLKIVIEGANVADFIDLFNTIYTRLGVPHEVIATPKRRGIRNDLNSLGKFLRNRWWLLQESTKRRISGKAA